LIGHHYSTALGTILLLCTFHSATKLPPTWRSNFLAGLAVLAIYLSLTVFPVLSWAWEGVDARLAELSTNLDPLEKLIPPEASLTAPPAVAARFWRRPALYYFPLNLTTVDFVVLPKYLPGYPAFSQSDLAVWNRPLRTSPIHEIVFENADVVLFRKLKNELDLKQPLR